MNNNAELVPHIEGRIRVLEEQIAAVQHSIEKHRMGAASPQEGATGHYERLSDSRRLGATSGWSGGGWGTGWDRASRWGAAGSQWDGDWRPQQDQAPLAVTPSAPPQPADERGPSGSRSAENSSWADQVKAIQQVGFPSNNMWHTWVRDHQVAHLGYDPGRHDDSFLQDFLTAYLTGKAREDPQFRGRGEDWRCACGFINFSRRTTCKECGRDCAGASGSQGTAQETTEAIAPAGHDAPSAQAPSAAQPQALVPHGAQGAASAAPAALPPDGPCLGPDPAQAFARAAVRPSYKAPPVCHPGRPGGLPAGDPPGRPGALVRAVSQPRDEPKSPRTALEDFRARAGARDCARVKYFAVPGRVDTHFVFARVDVRGDGNVTHVEGRGGDVDSAERDAAKSALSLLLKTQGRPYETSRQEEPRPAPVLDQAVAPPPAPPPATTPAPLTPGAAGRLAAVPGRPPSQRDADSSDESDDDAGQFDRRLSSRMASQLRHRPTGRPDGLLRLEAVSEWCHAPLQEVRKVVFFSRRRGDYRYELSEDAGTGGWVRARHGHSAAIDRRRLRWSIPECLRNQPPAPRLDVGDLSWCCDEIRRWEDQERGSAWHRAVAAVAGVGYDLRRLSRWAAAEYYATIQASRP